MCLFSILCILISGDKKTQDGGKLILGAEKKEWAGKSGRI